MPKPKEQVDFSDLGMREDELRVQKQLEQQQLLHQQEQQAEDQRRRQRDLLNAKYRVFCFLTDRPELGEIQFAVNIKSGQVCARQLFKGPWGRLQASYAIRWYRGEDIQTRPLDLDLLESLPGWFWLPSDEGRKIRGQLKRQTIWSWLTLNVVQSCKFVAEATQHFVTGIFFLLALTAFGAIVAYVAYDVLGGVAGLLKFGWKNLE